MKKILKFAYPVLTSLLFYVFFFVMVFAINYAYSGEGYGGLGLALLLIVLWVLVAVPLSCYFYGKIIRNEKHKYLYATYNAFITALVYFLPFASEDETYQYGLILFGWVLLWSLVFTAIQRSDLPVAENDNDTSVKTLSRAELLLQNKKNRMVALCFTVILTIETVLFTRISTLFSERYYEVFLEITPLAIVLIFLLGKNMDGKYRAWLLTGAFGIVLLTNINSIIFNVKYAITYGNIYNHIISLVFSCLVALSSALMVTGTVCDFKFIRFLKYGALAKAVIPLANIVLTVVNIVIKAETVAQVFERIGLILDALLGALCSSLFCFGIFVLACGKLNHPQAEITEENKVI